jgi:hypothetical protein
VKNVPDGYQKYDFVIYEAPNERYTAGSNAMSYEEAAELGARYVWEMYAKSLEGKTVAMTYSAFPSQTRPYWTGFIGDSKEAVENHEYEFIFNLCAISGERIGITRLRCSDSGLSRRDIKIREAIDELFQEEKRLSEVESLFSTEPPEHLDEYAEAVKSHAVHHFTGTEVVNVVLKNVSPLEFNIDEKNKLTVVSHSMFFMVTDNTGREAQVFISMELKELIAIDTQHSDIVPGYDADAPGAVG